MSGAVNLITGRPFNHYFCMLVLSGVATINLLIGAGYLM